MKRASPSLFFGPTLALIFCSILAAMPNDAAAAKPRKTRPKAAPTTGQKAESGVAKREESAPSAAKDAPKQVPAKSAESSESSVAKTPAAAGHDVVERESRIEFDERVVHGQSAAGAIYLFQRAPSEFRSIVDVPDSFRARTVRTLSAAGASH